jgi:hypothetical protein
MSSVTIQFENESDAAWFYSRAVKQVGKTDRISKLDTGILIDSLGKAKEVVASSKSTFDPNAE